MHPASFDGVKGQVERARVVDHMVITAAWAIEVRLAKTGLAKIVLASKGNLFILPWIARPPAKDQADFLDNLLRLQFLLSEILCRSAAQYDRAILPDLHQKLRLQRVCIFCKLGKTGADQDHDRCLPPPKL